MDGVINQHPLSLGSFEPTPLILALPESCWSGQDQLRRQARGTLERSGSELSHETMVVTTHMSAGKYIILWNVAMGCPCTFLADVGHLCTLCIGPSLADFASLWVNGNILWQLTGGGACCWTSEAQGGRPQCWCEIERTWVHSDNKIDAHHACKAIGDDV